MARVICHESPDLEYGGGHDEDNDAGGTEAAEEHKDGEEDGGEAGDHVLPELLADDLVGLPVGVSHRQGEHGCADYLLFHLWEGLKTKKNNKSNCPNLIIVLNFFLKGIRFQKR